MRRVQNSLENNFPARAWQQYTSQSQSSSTFTHTHTYRGTYVYETRILFRPYQGRLRFTDFLPVFQQTIITNVVDWWRLFLRKHAGSKARECAVFIYVVARIKMQEKRSRGRRVRMFSYCRGYVQRCRILLQYRWYQEKSVLQIN